MEITDFSFTPRCPRCQAPLAYLVAPHDGPCKLAAGKQPRRGSLDHFVMRCYAYYPSLYGRNAWSRWHIFEHLFIIVGNGTEWSEGRLQLPKRLRQYEPKGPWMDYRPSKLSEVRTTQDFDRWLKLMESESEDPSCDYYGEEEFKRLSTLPQYFSGLSDYSKIFDLPANIRPDWFQGCIDMLRMLKIQPATFKYGPVTNTEKIDPTGNLEKIRELSDYLRHFAAYHAIPVADEVFE